MLLKLLSGSAASLGLAAAVGGIPQTASRMFSVSAQSQENIYQFSARDIDGNQVTSDPLTSDVERVKTVLQVI